MKKTKKHIFHHPDPEKVAQSKEVKTQSVSPKAKNGTQSFIQRDLKKTILSITAFIALLAIIYLISIKTGYLKPVYKIFGL